MTLQSTSLLAFADVLEHLNERQVQVLKCLTEIQPATNMMIADKLNWSINRVTPRCLEMRKKGLIRKDRIDKCEITGRNSIYWRVFRKL